MLVSKHNMQANTQADSHSVHTFLFVFNKGKVTSSAFAWNSAVYNLHINHMTVSLRLRYG